MIRVASESNRGVVHAALEALMARHGLQGWWPAQTAFEVAVGAVLVQHVAWRNVEQAIDKLRAQALLDAGAMTHAAMPVLEAAIRPSGTFRVKAQRLKALAGWWRTNSEGAAFSATSLLRQSLLQVRGIGPETADCILLYAFERPVFVADAYARRWLARLGVVSGTESYDALKAYAESVLPADPVFLNEAHAVIVRHAQRTCRRSPECGRCCVQAGCAQEVQAA